MNMTRPWSIPTHKESLTVAPTLPSTSRRGAGDEGAAEPHGQFLVYGGRAEADLTPWLEYFVTSVATVFHAVKEEALSCAQKGISVEPDALRRLDRRSRRVFALFSRQDRIATPEVAGALGLSDRMARVLLHGWVKVGWLVVAQASKRARAYGLAESYRQFIGKLSAITPPEER